MSPKFGSKEMKAHIARARCLRSKAFHASLRALARDTRAVLVLPRLRRKTG